MSDSILPKLYDYSGDFYVLKRGNALLVEGPEEQTPPRDPPETVLRVFMSIDDAAVYRTQGRFTDAKVGKTTLVGLWEMLVKLTELSEQNFQCPMAIELSAPNLKGEVRCVHVLHSRHSLPA